MSSSNDAESGCKGKSDYMYMNYAPETCEDLSFCGAAVGAPRCRVHGMEPRKSVAFEGANTGRRFYECCVQDYAENCGFVEWVDAEPWPETLQNSLNRLWFMFHEASEKRIEERIGNAKLVEELLEEKEKFKRNYYSLMDDVAKLLRDTEKEKREEHERKMNEEKDAIFDLDRRGLEAEVCKLNSELFDLKEEKKEETKQWEATKKQWEATEKQWENKEVSWKEEKKKLEYSLFKLFKVNNGNKEKLLKIKETIGEI